MNRIFSAFAALALGLLVVSCTGETVDYSEPTVTHPELSDPTGDLSDKLPDVAPPSVASAPLSSIPAYAIEGFNDFSLRFYLANSESTRENVCVSPLSVGTVLAMIANGDDGMGRNEILKLLGFKESEAGLNALNKYYQTLLSNLPNIEEDISCNTTNTLWCDPSKYRIRKSFMQAITDSYYAYGIGINPSGEEGKNAINEFVGKNTHGLIDEFLTSPLKVDLAFLNTIYFKAGWSLGFNEDFTKKRPFHDICGKLKETDFMFRCNIMEYAVTGDGTEAVRLNYGKLQQFSMTCILPSSHVSLDEALTYDNIKSINVNLKEEYMIAWLPKFEVETNNPKTLDILKGLGLEKVCGEGSRATFSLITESDEFYLDCFIHATKIKVDENGSEGAAASLGGMELTLGPGDENNAIREIVFDRPFIFYIQENTTGSILFIGSVKTFS